MKTLKVYYENTLVGTLIKTPELTYSFSYEESWQQSSQSFPLSLAMPLSQREFGNRVTVSFFENLLPEGEVRQHLEATYQVKDPFEFLKKFGRDCAGAVIVTDQEDYTFSADITKVESINMSKIYEAIQNHEPVMDVIADINIGYLSLAGAQDKFPAILKGNEFFLPVNGAPTTHIVKAPIWRSGVNESVYNEHYCMQLAKALGLPVPHCMVIDGDFPLFAIERYDRIFDSNGGVHRLHQQDFCQAQGLSSQSKYESHGGPSLKNNYDIILNNVSIKKRAENLKLFMDWVCFNLFIGNNDSHSKNISLLHCNGRVELAPFYDLMCTALYSKLKKSFSFNIGDRDIFHEIGRKQFESLEDQVGVKRGTWLERLTKMNEKILEVKDQVAHEVLSHHPDCKIVSRISDFIKQRSKGLKSQRAL